MSWCDGHGLQPAALYILGYGLKVRAALQLESEGVAESQSGNFECLITLRVFDLVSCG
jgi:hypothetical protein